jgi:hypothetical protein
MALRKVGFFRELRHGDPDGPSLEMARSQLGLSERSRIALYLRGGGVVATTGTLVGDYFDRRASGVATAEVRTDGIWVWPADLAFYVEKYGVGLPSEFLQHMEGQEFEPPLLEEGEIQRAEEDLFGS